MDEQRFKDHDRYGMLRLEITDEAVTGELLGKGRSFFRTGEVPLEAFMQWTFMDEYCGIVPFKLPTCASLKAIPAILNHTVEGVARGGLDVKCEIIFLGDNFLRLRVPAVSSIGSPFNGRSDGMIEFGGARRDLGKIQAWSDRSATPPSPRDSMAMRMNGWSYRQ